MDTKIVLVSIRFFGDGGRWVVSDGRRALDDYPCASKGAVLSKVAEILDDMDKPELKLADETEVTILVTAQVSLCDLDTQVYTPEVRKSVAKAILSSLNWGEGEGFVHPMAEDISIGIVGAETLTVN